jgi:hypothetical protein
LPMQATRIGPLDFAEVVKLRPKRRDR